MNLLSHTAQRRSLDLALLDLARHNVDAVLRDDDKVRLNLVDLLDQTGELLTTLDKHLLIVLRILTKKSLALVGLYIVVHLNGLVLLDSQLGGLQKSLRRGENLLLLRGRRSCLGSR